MKIGPGVSELWEVEYRPLPLTRPMAYTTSCTTVQAVMRSVYSGCLLDDDHLFETELVNKIIYEMKKRKCTRHRWLVS